MEWILKLSDQPTNADYPIEAHFEPTPGLISSKKYVSCEEVISILSNRHTEEEFIDSKEMSRRELVFSPILPEGTLVYAQDPKGELEQVIFEIPQKSFDIQYKETGKLYSMPFPRLIVICELQKEKELKKIGSMRLFAVENNGEPIAESTPLFAFPYSNVMKSSGAVCWGMNERLLVSSLHEVKKALFLFFSAPFNEDHGVRTTLGINEFKGLIKKLEEQPFSDELLVPANKTFGDTIRELAF